MRHARIASLEAAIALNERGGLLGLFEVDHRVYHDGPGLNSTRIKDAYQSPAHAVEAAKHRKETAAMAFGTAVHCAILEPERFAVEYCALPRWKNKGNVKAGIAERNDFYAQWGDSSLPNFLEADEAEDIDGIVAAVERSASVRWLLDGSVRELAAYWKDEELGTHCKAKFDIWRGGDVIADIKTTEDARPEAFNREIAKWDYPLSAAHYAAGAKAITGDSQAFVWIAIEKTAPYGIKCFCATPAQMEVGERRRRDAMRRMVAWEIAGNLHAVYPDSIVEAELPHWYMKGTANEQ